MILEVSVVRKDAMWSLWQDAIGESQDNLEFWI